MWLLFGIVLLGIGPLSPKDAILVGLAIRCIQVYRFDSLETLQVRKSLRLEAQIEKLRKEVSDGNAHLH